MNKSYYWCTIAYSFESDKKRVPNVIRTVAGRENFARRGRFIRFATYKVGFPIDGRAITRGKPVSDLPRGNSPQTTRATLPWRLELESPLRGLAVAPPIADRTSYQPDGSNADAAFAAPQQRAAREPEGSMSVAAD